MIRTQQDRERERKIRAKIEREELLSGTDEDYLLRILDETRGSLRRLRASLATFVRETADPGVEALAAIAEAERLL